MERKEIQNKGHSKCKGPEAGALALFEDRQGSQGLALSDQVGK